MRKKEELYYLCSENKALISFALTAQLIRAFVFTYACCWFSYAVAHLSFKLFCHVVLYAISVLKNSSNYILNAKSLMIMKYR